MATRKKSSEFDYIIEDLRQLALPIEAVKPASSNARNHPPSSIRGIATSLKRYKQRKPIVYNVKSKEIVAGNGTYLAALQLGWTHIAVVKVRDDPTTETGYALAADRTAPDGRVEKLKFFEDSLSIIALAKQHLPNQRALF